MNVVAKHELISCWEQLARHLEHVWSRDIDIGNLSDRMRRVANENGRVWLIASAIGEAFDRNCHCVNFEDIDGVQSVETVLGWDEIGQPFLITEKLLSGDFYVTNFDGAGAVMTEVISRRKLRKRFSWGTVFEIRPTLCVWDRNPDPAITKRWFGDSARPLFHTTKYLILAAIVGNILAVCVSLFALQVWDRVIPAQSFSSLSVLMIGVLFAIIFEMVLRLQRSALIDAVGIDVDKSISNLVFSQMLGLQADARPSSLGSLAAQVREINQIREAFSSSMLSAAIDLPFSAVFLIAIYLIGPNLVIPIVGAIVLILVIYLFAQLPLSKLAQEGLEESSVRNGLIVESVMKAEDFKLLQAEQTIQIRWNQVVETGNIVSNKQRRWRSFLNNFTQSVQQATYVLVVSYGAYMVISGDMTMGQVIACSILTNRAIAPLVQVSSVMATLQGSIVAKRSIDSLMQLPTDTPTKNHLRRKLFEPAYNFQNVRYNYPETEHGGLILPKLEIPFGSKICVLGRIGSGKSTLLKVLSGLVQPGQGSIIFGNTEMSSIHPGDLRRAIGFQSQSAALLRGSIRDNLQVAKPSATEREMIEACKVSGATSLLTTSPKGLDLSINETGDGLSGGQRQSLLLARTILKDPQIVLLDEPTASMDQNSEAAFINAMKIWGQKKTIIIATHRTPPLQLCDRLIVVDEGRIVLDGAKEEILAQLKANGANT